LKNRQLKLKTHTYYYTLSKNEAVNCGASIQYIQ